MCVSIVFGINLTNGETGEFTERVRGLGRAYGYGVGFGRESLLPGAEAGIIKALGAPETVFEVHDLPEPHCACDIDHDIRISSKLGRKSRFFDFVRETLGYAHTQSAAVLFFQEELPDEGNVRKQLGSFEGFVNLLNRWHTWQVEGFEPTREAYFIADETPLLYTFTDKKLSQ